MFREFASMRVDKTAKSTPIDRIVSTRFFAMYVNMYLTLCQKFFLTIFMVQFLVKSLALHMEICLVLLWTVFWTLFWEFSRMLLCTIKWKLIRVIISIHNSAEFQKGTQIMPLKAPSFGKSSTLSKK